MLSPAAAARAAAERDIDGTAAPAASDEGNNEGDDGGRSCVCVYKGGGRTRRAASTGWEQVSGERQVRPLSPCPPWRCLLAAAHTRRHHGFVSRVKRSTSRGLGSRTPGPLVRSGSAACQICTRRDLRLRGQTVCLFGSLFTALLSHSSLARHYYRSQDRPTAAKQERHQGARHSTRNAAATSVVISMTLVVMVFCSVLLCSPVPIRLCLALLLLTHSGLLPVLMVVGFDHKQM